MIYCFQFNVDRLFYIFYSWPMLLKSEIFRVHPHFQFVELVCRYWSLWIFVPPVILLGVVFLVPKQFVFKAITLTALILALIWSGLFWLSLDPQLVAGLSLRPEDNDNSRAALGMLLIFIFVLWVGPLALLSITYAIVMILAYCIRKPYLETSSIEKIEL